MQRWQSGWHNCSTSSTSPSTNDGPTSISVPQTGIYAFCFGTNTSLKVVVDQQHLQPRGDSVARDSASDKHGDSINPGYLLRIQGSSSSFRNNEIIQHQLPLQHQGQPLFSTRVGRRLFLYEGALVDVVTSTPMVAPTTIQDGSNKAFIDYSAKQKDDNRRPQLSSSRVPQWCVQYICELTRPLDSSCTASATFPLLGALSTDTKQLVCTYCRRTFPSIKAVYNHGLHAHPVETSPYFDAPESSQPNHPLSSTTASMWQTPLQVVYLDEAMAVVVKPQGMPVQGNTTTSLIRSNLLLPLMSTSSSSTALVSGIKHHMPVGTKFSSPTTSDLTSSAVPAAKQQESIEADRVLTKPRPVHRLDSATGGLLVLAKTTKAERILRQCFANRTCMKRYRALVLGRLETSDETKSMGTVLVENTIDGMTKVASNTTTLDTSTTVTSNDGASSHDQHNSTIRICQLDISGKEAITRYQSIRYVQSLNSRDGWLTVVDLWPLTGRRHQIRKHLQSLGHPIYGDTRYGGRVTTSTTHDIGSTSSTKNTIKNTIKASDNMCSNPESTSTSSTKRTLDSISTSESHTINPTIVQQQQQLSKFKDDPLMLLDPCERMCLWAMEIRLPHPLTGIELCCIMENPEWLEYVIAYELRQWTNQSSALVSSATIDHHE